MADLHAQEAHQPENCPQARFEPLAGLLRGPKRPAKRPQMAFFCPKTQIRVLSAVLSRIAHRLSEEHTLVRAQLEFPGGVPLVAIVEMSGQALGCGK